MRGMRNFSEVEIFFWGGRGWEMTSINYDVNLD